MNPDSAKKIPVSIVMPVFNEQEVIEKSVRDYHAEILEQIPGSEMVIVDDCSTDDTPVILKSLAQELEGITIFKTERNSGHGKALRLAYENAARDIIFHTDSDYQFYPKDFWKLYEEADENDLTIGFRALRKDPVSRLIVTNILRLSNILIFGYNIKDANSPFKIIRKDCLNECLKVIDPDAFAPSIMLTVTARWKGYRVKELPVGHLPRLTGEVSIKKWKLVKACFLSLSQNIELRKKLGSS
ncbi:MAG: glycosyltransferase family 2 protein [Pirellulales bacterium]|nr:glycosyltransferase family 2 protein [Pirellulales bacterium]